MLDKIVKWFNSRPTWQTWIGHGLAGLGGGLIDERLGAFVVGFYTGKEFKESDNLKNVRLDNFMDWVCPLIGASVGIWLRRLLF